MPPLNTLCRPIKRSRPLQQLGGIVVGLLLAAGHVLATPMHTPVPGGVAVLQVGSDTDGAAAPAVRFNDVPQPVVRQGRYWFALVGLPLDTAAGRHQVVIGDGVDAGKEQPLPFEVRPKNYPTQRLRIPDQRMVQPPPELDERIVAEQQRIAAMKRHFSPKVPPDTDFVLPAKGRLSARFGVRRVLNGEPRSPHSGLDVAVGTGQTVRAASSGTVLAVEDFYFTGGTVVVDHGQGVLTLYAHLSRIDVTPGQALKKGEPLGASGVSGRATGPHLHWVVVVGGSSVDPELFLPRR
jgi:hypothetical protein